MIVFFLSATMLGTLFLTRTIPLHSKPKPINKETAINSDLSHFNNLDEQSIARYEKSIQQGLDYLSRPSTEVSPFQQLLLDYLQRKFSLDPKFSAAHTTIQAPTDGWNVVKFHVFQRIAYPNKLIDVLPTDNPLPTAKLLMAATHCDHVSLPENFRDLLKQNLSDGGYGTTYVAISLEFMKENGCSLSDEETRKLRNQVAEDMVKLANNSETSGDLRYGAIAFLMQMGRRDLVQKSWVDQIVSEQQADDGYKVIVNEGTSTDHPTVMALWALLEYARPNAPDEPILRRPN